MTADRNAADRNAADCDAADRNAADRNAADRNAAAYTVAGVTVALESADPSLPARFHGPALAFRAPPGAPADLTLAASWRDLAAETGRTLFDSGGVWQAYEQDGHERLRLFAGAPTPYKAVELEHARGTGTLWLDRGAHAQSHVELLEYPLDELIFAQLFASRGAALIHAAGVAWPDGGGDLLVAASGGGKSTLALALARHAPHARVLSDERIALTPDGAGYRMHGTPWPGDANAYENASARLERVLFLAHGPTNHLAPLSAGVAAARLYACAFPPVHDRGLVARTLDVVARVAECVPALDLINVPGPGVVELLRGGR